MTTYKGTHGTKIQNYTSDPANPLVGEVWFNDTSDSLKVNAGALVGAWATGGDLNTARGYLAGAGISTSALAFGGKASPGNTAATEKYNGTSWTEVNDLNQVRRALVGAGTTNTAALAFGGLSPGTDNPGKDVTELWNGTNWTEVNDLNTGRTYTAGFGTSTAALVGGGAGVGITNTELWNGTNWTEVNDLNLKRRGWGASGTTTAGLGFSGYSDPSVPSNFVKNVESWNGTNWTEVNDVNTERGGGPFGCGTQTSSLFAAGGNPGKVALTESWNGTNWTEVGDLSSARGQVGSAGTDNTSGLVFGSSPFPSPIASTEEWSFSGGIQTIDTD